MPIEPYKEEQISIHAAQEGCDSRCADWGRIKRNFNPRSPRGLRPTLAQENIIGYEISIHAAQEGCDSVLKTPHLKLALFQSTQPKRAATLFPFMLIL